MTTSKPFPKLVFLVFVLASVLLGCTNKVEKTVKVKAALKGITRVIW